jgi:hypothetical protein
VDSRRRFGARGDGCGHARIVGRQGRARKRRRAQSLLREEFTATDERRGRSGDQIGEGCKGAGLQSDQLGFLTCSVTAAVGSESGTAGPSRFLRPHSARAAVCPVYRRSRESPPHRRRPSPTSSCRRIRGDRDDGQAFHQNGEVAQFVYEASCRRGLQPFAYPGIAGHAHQLLELISRCQKIEQALAP